MNNFIIILILSFLPLQGNSVTLDLLPNTGSYAVTPMLGLHRDNSGQMSFAEAQKQKFIPIEEKGLLVPFGDGTSWLKIVLTNRNPLQKQWVMEWDNAMAEEIDFYISEKNGSYRVKQAGMVQTANRTLMAENKPFLQFDLDYNATRTIYIKVKGQRAHYASVNLFSDTAYHKHQLKQFNIYGFLSGAIAIRLFYVLILALFAVRDKDFRQYSVLLVARSFAFWSLHGLIGNLFSDPATVLTGSFLCFHILPIGLIIAFRVIFPINRFPAWVEYLLKSIVVADILLGVATLFAYRWELIMASTYLMIFTQLFILCMYLYAIVRKYPINWNYSLAYLLGILSYIFIQMRLVEWVEFAWINPIALLFFILEFLVFGYFLGRILREYERTRALSTQELAFNREQNQRLQDLDRLKTRFFTNVSHEFRTPLSLLIAPLAEISKKYPREGLIPMMERNVNRLQLLINQLLDLSKLEAGAFKPELQRGDIGQFFAYIFASFESLAQSRQIHFGMKQSHPSYETNFDSDKIEKIITNLLSNAFKFTPAGGYVRIEIAYLSSTLSIKVEDSGIGIDAQRLPNIFDRFYQADNSSQRDYEGTGIGLALVKELVDLLQGDITVDSTINKGTIFNITLPLAANASEALPDYKPRSIQHGLAETVVEIHSQKTASDSQPTEELPILLIVEDNTDLRTYLHAMFTPYYQVVEAVDGQYGLEQALETVPDVIVTDLMMPRLDGFGLCQQLKSDQRTSHIPVVLLTARATLADRLEGYELGADDYLEKPFNKEELLVRVKNLIRQRATLREKFSLAVPVVPEVPVSKPQRLDNDFIVKAREIVELHLGDSRFSADDFGAMMEMSRSNLHRKLKALTGQTTTEFVRTIRLHKAQELLQQNNNTVSEVAYEVGFESLSYFSKTFQEYYGVLPSEVGDSRE